MQYLDYKKVNDLIRIKYVTKQHNNHSAQKHGGAAEISWA